MKSTKPQGPSLLGGGGVQVHCDRKKKLLVFVKNKNFSIILIVKITWHIELGRGIPCEPDRSQNHDTNQAVEQQIETEINRKKAKLPICTSL